jgi:hypothetical protein
MFKRLLVAFLLISGLVQSGLHTAGVGAYSIDGPNCRFDPANDNDGLGIGILTTDPLYDLNQSFSTSAGANAWNLSMVPQFTSVAYSSSTRDVRVEWENLGATVGARTTTWCGTGHYSADPLIEWGANASYYSTTPNRRKALAIHELGHAYGLNHNNSNSCSQSIAGLMFTDPVSKTNSCGWTSPTTDDVNGAIDAHNG